MNNTSVQLQDMSNMITLRDYLNKSMDNMNIRMSRDVVKNIQSKIAAIDTKLIELAATLDLSKVGEYDNFKFSVSSTEEPEEFLPRIMEEESKEKTVAAQPTKQAKSAKK